VIENTRLMGRGGKEKEVFDLDRQGEGEGGEAANTLYLELNGQPAGSQQAVMDSYEGQGTSQGLDNQVFTQGIRPGIEAQRFSSAERPFQQVDNPITHHAPAQITITTPDSHSASRAGGDESRRSAEIIT